MRLTPDLHRSTKKMQRCKSGVHYFHARRCSDAAWTFIVPTRSCSHATRRLARPCFSSTHACPEFAGSMPAARRADEIRARVQVFGGRVQVGRSWLHQRGASLQPWTFACRCGPCAIATRAVARASLTLARRGAPARAEPAPTTYLASAWIGAGGYTRSRRLGRSKPSHASLPSSAEAAAQRHKRTPTPSDEIQMENSSVPFVRVTQILGAH